MLINNVITERKEMAALNDLHLITMGDNFLKVFFKRNNACSLLNQRQKVMHPERYLENVVS